MLRALFVKNGKDIYISHLDLMRLFQRAFKRAGLSLTHTQGYNPRPSVSIALPLSLGVESKCELLDFQLEGSIVSMEEIRDRLNAALTPGVQVLEVYEDGRKIRQLALLRSVVTLEYDEGMPENAISQIQELFAQPEVLVEKKSKGGMVTQNIASMIRRIEVSPVSSKELELRVLACCQNPTLNPMLLGTAIAGYLPHLVPDFVHCRREEIYDTEENVFR